MQIYICTYANFMCINRLKYGYRKDFLQRDDKN